MRKTPVLAALIVAGALALGAHAANARSEEHTSELQPPDHIVCRLLLEKKTETAQGRTPASPTPTLPSHRPQALSPLSPGSSACTKITFTSFTTTSRPHSPPPTNVR